MLNVQTKLGESQIDGIGLFASERIRAGKIVWMMREDFDQRFTNLDDLPPFLQVQIRSYCFKTEDCFILCGDDARFINFAEPGETPNLIFGDRYNGECTLIAARGILSGEELTVGTETDLDSAWKLQES